MDFQLKSYGERALLVNELDESQQFELAERLEMAPPRGFVEYVLGHSNVLVLFETSEAVFGLKGWLQQSFEVSEGKVVESRLIEVPTRYDGEDLESVADQAQLSVDEVVAIHSGVEYRVRIMGFAPGFPYLDGLDPRLHLNRRSSPRDHIEPGSVAIGGSHAGIYSVASPGGWHLLGKTDLQMFRSNAAKVEQPDAFSVFALRPNDRVKFIKIS